MAINFNQSNPMSAFMSTAGGLQTLDRNNYDMQKMINQDQQALEQQQRAAAIQDQYGKLDFNDNSAVQQFVQQNPNYLDTVKGTMGFGDQRKEQALVDSAFSLNRAIDSGNPQAIQETIAGLQPIIDGQGDPSFTTQEALEMAKTPEGQQQLKRMAIGVMSMSTDPRAQNYLKQFTQTEQQQSVTEQGDRKLASGSGRYGANTTSMKDFGYYKKLKKTDPKAAAEFGRQKGYISKVGEVLPVALINMIDKADTAAVEAQTDIENFTDLADKFESNSKNLGGGLFGSWKEGLKEATGDEDAYSSLRRKWMKLKASEVVKNLPQGSASDADVAMAKGGFIGDNASPAEVASFLRGITKMKQVQVDFNRFKSNYISENNDNRGMFKAWREHSADMYNNPEVNQTDDNKNNKMQSRSSAKYNLGQTARNPQTGAVMVFTENGWTQQ